MILMTVDNLKVCVVGQHASKKFGGEASNPWVYFKLLRARGIDTTMVVHDRTRDELKAGFGDDFQRIHFVQETPADRFFYRLGRLLPGDLDSLSLAVFRHYLVQRRQRRVIRRLVKEGKVNIIHESAPVSPKQISALHGLGVPLVIGPLCGGVRFPPAFRYRQGRMRVWAEWLSETVSVLCNVLVPGKKQAEVLLVAHDLTRNALPDGCRGKIIFMPDISVDLSLWQDQEKPVSPPGKLTVIYLGRLVDWKAVDLLLEAFAGVAKQLNDVALQILGDGAERAHLEQQARELGIADKVEFAGYLSATESAQRMRAADIFVLPSLRECGGAVILEAMAVGLPVVVANWAGPGVHVTDETGIRVSPDSHQAYVEGIRDAIIKLAHAPQVRKQLGDAGKQRVHLGDYDWQRKIDRLLQVFVETIDETSKKS
jgi:glycosyltransferase involved in cell wall biosynthesis